MKTNLSALKNNKNLALTLEGGGARGAYQIGAVKALYSEGYTFKAIVGTSIGAINAAYIVQGDLEKIYKMWQEMSFKDLLELDNEAMKKLFSAKLDINTIKYLSKKLGESIKNKGLDVKKEREILENDIDEERIRNSNILFGLVTMCISDVNGKEMFACDIPKGKIVDYIMASSNLPVFKRVVIDDKKYLDGGAFDNCPVHMLEKKGFKNVIVIRAHKRLKIRGYKGILKRGNITMHMISPIDSMPSILNFDSDNLNNLLKLGYFDALKYIKGLDGYRYYFNNVTDDEVENILYNISIQDITNMLEKLNIKIVPEKNIKEIFFKKGIYTMSLFTKNKKILNTRAPIKDMFISIIEELGIMFNVDKYKIYDLNEYVKILKEKIIKDINVNTNKIKKDNLIFIDFIRSI